MRKYSMETLQAYSTEGLMTIENELEGAIRGEIAERKQAIEEKKQKKQKKKKKRSKTY